MDAFGMGSSSEYSDYQVSQIHLHKEISGIIFLCIEQITVSSRHQPNVTASTLHLTACAALHGVLQCSLLYCILMVMQLMLKFMLVSAGDLQPM